NILRTALTIRAGNSFRPVIKLRPDVSLQYGPLLMTSAPLVLEGMELHPAPPVGPPGSGGRNVAIINGAPLRAANCRFRGGIRVNQSPVSAFRNCEFLFDNGNVDGGRFQPGARLIFENCLHWSKGYLVGFYHDDPLVHDVSIEIKRSTFLSSYTPIWLG